MNQTDLVTFNQAIALAHAGQKELAYQRLEALFQSNPSDPNIVLWLAFTTPDLQDAESALSYIISIDPNNSNLPKAKEWLASEKRKRLEQTPTNRLAQLGTSPPMPYHYNNLPVCRKCGKPSGVFGALVFNRLTGRCVNCEVANKQALERFKATFLNITQDNDLPEEKWNRLAASAKADSLNRAETLNFIQDDAVRLLERIVSFANTGDILNEAIDSQLQKLSTVLAIPDNRIQPIINQVRRLRTLSDIRQGKFTTLDSDAFLESGELCYMDMGAKYLKTTARQSYKVHGRFLATNKKLRFLSSTEGGVEIPWTSIMRVSLTNDGVLLELSRKAGNGYYDVVDPWIAEATITTLVRMNNRHIFAQNSSDATRHIPQNVKIAVWQRDQGKCVQCGAKDYLEYDHIIPFSLGGASTVQNVQVLCRKCNLAKSNKI